MANLKDFGDSWRQNSDQILTIAAATHLYPNNQSEFSMKYCEDDAGYTGWRSSSIDLLAFSSVYILVLELGIYLGIYRTIWHASKLRLYSVTQNAAKLLLDPFGITIDELEHVRIRVFLCTSTCSLWSDYFSYPPFSLGEHLLACKARCFALSLSVISSLTACVTPHPKG